MADPKALPPGRPAVFTLREATYTAFDVRVRVQETTTQVLDVTPEARMTMVEVSKNEHAIPAQEATKQEQELTKRTIALAMHDTWRFVIAGVCVLVAIAALTFKPGADGTAIAAIVGVFGAIVGGPPAIDRLRKGAPALPPRNEGKSTPAGSDP